MAAPSKPRRPPATTPEARENRLVGLAFDLAEKQLAEGTASSQVQVHYLKLGTAREKLEIAKLENENKLLLAKVDAMASGKIIEELYGKAIIAMSKYQGNAVDDDDYDE